MYIINNIYIHVVYVYFKCVICLTIYTKNAIIFVMSVYLYLPSQCVEWRKKKLNLDLRQRDTYLYSHN